jgi:putative transposase
LFKIELRYDLQFLEIGIDGNHVRFLIQSVPMNSPKKIISTVKSITAKEIFRIHPEVKRFLWGGNFWTTGYYVNTVGQYANEEVIKKYLQNQGKSDYEKLHSDKLRLF